MGDDKKDNGEIYFVKLPTGAIAALNAEQYAAYEQRSAAKAAAKEKATADDEGNNEK